MFSMKIEGGAQFAKALEDLSPSRERGLLNKMLIKAGEPLRQRMEDNAPVEEGKPDLKDHILILPVSGKTVDDPSLLDGRERGASEGVVAVGPQLQYFYGSFAEFGTVKQPARPWARPAFDSTVGRVLTIFQQDIWAWLRQRSERSKTSTTRRNL